MDDESEGFGKSLHDLADLMRSLKSQCDYLPREVVIGSLLSLASYYMKEGGCLYEEEALGTFSVFYGLADKVLWEVEE